MICKHCKQKVIYDQEGDLIHIRFYEQGVDERMCEPNNSDSKIAEVD